ncbi:transposon Tf2-1 polyprotein isoform X1 [Cucumis melo var. makuwa]|uniref:Transposon Tf2-1 polyprotein isoform X1 n=1 Tax=Cucumis melo var. makuwa TaxID=1194695 RepID=A0A5A7SRY2_CUCMM|nr:transposon Tf2-1 polyprotein isoform X1 [Cucumis melo var. makuwa]TYK30354.1 transposon Tf2-1 polyprotein isoform X1 [Cucumis melo var. makuwa]
MRREIGFKGGIFQCEPSPCEEWLRGRTDEKYNPRGYQILNSKLRGRRDFVFIAKKSTMPAIVLPTKETSNYGVILGSGVAIKEKRICGKVELMVGDWKISDSFLPIELGGVPPHRAIEHCIHLRKGTDLVNVQPYRHAYQQKEEMEKLVDEMLASGANYGSVAAPLTQLLKLGAYKWLAEAQTGFEKLTTMMTLPILAMLDFNLPFEIQMDASRKFTVKTDQRSLKFLLEQQVIQSQHRKWIAKLLGYSFEVVYKLGLENKAVDALSRVPPAVHLNHISAPALLDLTIIIEEILKYEERLVISKISSLLPTILHTYHDSVFGGHWGLLRTGFINAFGNTDAIWSEISMDFIEGLPKVVGFELEVILVVVDRMHKYGHFVVLKHPNTAKSVVEIFAKGIVWLHGFSKVFLSQF